MGDMVIGRIEQLYKDSPHKLDNWLIDVDKEITGGDLIKAYKARIQELKKEVGYLSKQLCDYGHVQNCHQCIDINCGDNTTETPEEGEDGNWD